MITWEPVDWAAQRTDYQLSDILAGRYDAYISAFAADAAASGQRVLVRLGHEMNGEWYPWSEGANGNAPGEFTAVWHHVVAQFVAAGATNVEWVWSPNVEFAGSTPLAGLYPGDGAVDWIAVDGYNFGTSQPDSRWMTFTEIFEPTLAAISRLAPDTPLIIGETGCTEVGGDKARWITDMFDALERHPEIRALTWFEFDKETDWRVVSSSAAQSAFAAGAARPFVVETAVPPLGAGSGG